MIGLVKNYIDRYFFKKSGEIHIQFLRYIVVGGNATLADIVSLYFLADYFGWHYLLAGGIAFSVGLLTNYFLSIAWVFQSTGNFKKEFLIFSLIGIGGLILNELILLILVSQFNTHYLQAKIISVAVVLFWNFGMRRKFVF